MKLFDLEQRIEAGESERLEFKKSTGHLNRAGEMLCAFLNADGGTVMIDVTPAGKAVGQEVSDKTEREIASVLQRFEPPAPGAGVDRGPGRMAAVYRGTVAVPPRRWAR